MKKNKGLNRYKMKKELERKINRYADFIFDNTDTFRNIFVDSVTYQFSQRDSLLQECPDPAKLKKFNSRAEIQIRNWDSDDEKESTT